MQLWCASAPPSHVEEGRDCERASERARAGLLAALAPCAVCCAVCEDSARTCVLCRMLPV